MIKNLEIVAFNRESEFWRIPKKELMDSVLGIRMANVADREALEKWAEYYAILNVPFCIVMSTTPYATTAAIWTRRRVKRIPGQSQAPFPLKQPKRSEILFRKF